MDIESEEGIRSVVLRRREESGLGFSIMGGAGYDFPPVIYGIEKDSPAAISGLLEAGDVILSINEREVVKLSTKEVLKCLRLSGDIVHIKFKRDPHVVSRVRQFLSTPNYHLDTQDNHIHPQHQHLSPSKQKQKKQSQIPVYQYQPLSPTKSQQAPHPPPPPQADQVDHVSITNKQNISFTDELFINHSFQQVQHSPCNKPNKVHAHIYSPQEKHQLAHQESAAANPKNGQRKNFETFVMTGEAILNVSRNDTNEGFKTSPSKTASKLMPMPHMPIFVERDKDYNRRLMLGKEMEKEANSKDKSESSENSPPLPPPPNDTSSYSSDKNKSDHLPPPPPPEDSSLKNGHSHNKTVENGNNGSEVDRTNNYVNGTSNRCPNHQNNNEDTSVSSSVMSDSGDEIADGGDEDVKKMCAPPISSSSSPKRGKMMAKKSNSTESYDGDKEGEKAGGPEKERYNEYILLNGSRGTLNEEDLSGSGGRQSVQQHSYSQAINKGEKTPSTVTGGHDHSESEGDVDGDDSISESDIIGAGFDRFGGSHTHDNVSGGESDSSDVESMRIAPVTKAVDVPSAERLAKRLYQLDGFKATDVWRQLSKNTDFNRIVATEYLKFFTFKDETLDVSLRKFLSVCPLKGETQDRERVLSYFSARFVDCNPNTFGSQDSVHTLACALMLLHTDLYHGMMRNQRMTCPEFIENLSGLNDGGDFPREILKQLYLSIKAQPLGPPDADDEDSTKELPDPPVASNTNVYKTGYLVRKCTHEFGGKKTSFGKRSWKMFFCRLKELLLVLSPDESANTPASRDFPIKLHHCFASIASDYRKKKNVFRLILADKTQFLFLPSDTREMNSWIDMINWNAARFSSPALDAPVGSSARFEKPLLPSGVSKWSSREQATIHQRALNHWEKELDILTQPKKKGSSSNLKKEEKEKLLFYQFEIKRYRTYLEILEKRSHAENSQERNGGSEEVVELQVLPNPPSVLLEEES